MQAALLSAALGLITPRGVRRFASEAYRFELVDRTQHQLVRHFYRGHRSAANARADDELWAARCCESSAIVGAVVLSPRGAERINFVRSLFVAPSRRRHGVGTTLLTRATAARRCYCFAYAELEPLYRAAGFARLDPDCAPAWMRSSFDRISRQQSQKSRQLVLMAMLVDESAAAPAPVASSTEQGEARATSDVGTPRRATLLVVQHARERGRATATAPLLEHALLAPHLDSQIARWSGRADNERVAEALAGVASPMLLWTGGAPTMPTWVGTSGGTAESAGPEPPAGAPPTYVLLDGTWQEATDMFRKGPTQLRQMPRLTLAGRQSSFRLRRDFGWRRRVSGGLPAPPPGLLCTAEVAAAVIGLDGDVEGEATLLGLLSDFQALYERRGGKVARQVHLCPRENEHSPPTPPTERAGRTPM